MAEPISLNLRDNKRRQASCGYCHEKISGLSHRCRACNTPMHEDCYRELGRCPTLGCVDSAQWKAEDQWSAGANTDDDDADLDEVSFRVVRRGYSDRFGRFGAYITLALALIVTTIVWLFTLWFAFISLVLCWMALAGWGFQGLIVTLFFLALNALFFGISVMLTRWSGAAVKAVSH